MTWKADMTLEQLTAELRNLCAEVERIEARGETLTQSEERDSLCNQILLVTDSLEMGHGTITTVFGLDVPAETQKMYFKLEKCIYA